MKGELPFERFLALASFGALLLPSVREGGCAIGILRAVMMRTRDPPMTTSTGAAEGMRWFRLIFFGENL